MKYELSKEFRAKYKKQDVRIRKAIDKTLKTFSKNPNDNSLQNKELDPPYQDYRSIKIDHKSNDYRAIFELCDEGEDQYASFNIFGTHAELYTQ